MGNICFGKKDKTEVMLYNLMQSANIRCQIALRRYDDAINSMDPHKITECRKEYEMCRDSYYDAFDEYHKYINHTKK